MEIHFVKGKKVIFVLKVLVSEGKKGQNNMDTKSDGRFVKKELGKKSFVHVQHLLGLD